MSKLERLIGLKVSEADEELLRKIARIKKTTPQGLLRVAVDAIFECYQEHKNVPLDMMIVQRKIGLSESALSAMAAESPQADYDPNGPAKGTAPPRPDDKDRTSRRRAG